MIYQILAILILTKWWTAYTLQKSSYIEQIFPIPRHLFFYLNLCISNGTVSTKIMIYGVILILILSISHFWMAMTPGVHPMGYTYLNLLDSPELLQILVTLTAVIKPLLSNFLGRAIVIFKLRKAFSKFYRRHSALVEKYSVSLKTFLQQGISEPEFYGDLVYRFRIKCRKI